jgi:hypothetical protein
MELSEIEVAINNIQHDVWDTSLEDEQINVELRTNGSVMLIYFLGIQLWNDEDDARNYTMIDDEEIRESLEEFLRKEIRVILRKLRMIEV